MLGSQTFSPPLSDLKSLFYETTTFLVTARSSKSILKQQQIFENAFQIDLTPQLVLLLSPGLFFFLSRFSVSELSEPPRPPPLWCLQSLPLCVEAGVRDGFPGTWNAFYCPRLLYCVLNPETRSWLSPLTESEWEESWCCGTLSSGHAVAKTL